MGALFSCPCCPSKTAEKPELLTTAVVNERWRVLRQIGKGGFGSVYAVEDLTSTYDADGKAKLYAMKTETVKVKDGTGRLPQEALVLQEIMAKGKTRHICQLFDVGRVTQTRKKPLQFIVMTLLGPSLSEMRRLCRKERMCASTVALIGVQGIESIEDLHSCGFIHRDVKPGNFVLGMTPNHHKIYMIDFGMCRKFLDGEGRLKPVRKSMIKFRGTYRYCASDSHKGVEYSRHHDLWCMFNSLVELRHGELPWQISEDDATATFEIKNRIIPRRWLHDLEPEYLDVYETLTSLHYDIKPDYERLRQFFVNILAKENLNLASPFEWEPNGLNRNYFRTEDLNRLFNPQVITV
uniref:non-specific serine/threonine protein kinase n=1 Tax=Romanomermis culicivorax TaxID=13658 RepID=A0A915J9B9_ROMCU